MASSSKPTGAHYALVVFVLISIVCGLGWLLAYKGANNISELRAAAAIASKKAAEKERLADSYHDDLARLKNILGYPHSKVGDATEPNTVSWTALNDIKKYGTGGEQSMHALLARQNDLLREAQEARDKLHDLLETEQTQFKQQVEALTGQLTAEKSTKDVVSRSKIDADNSHSESVKQKDDLIADLRKTRDAIQQQADENGEAVRKKIKELDTRVAGLSAINQKLTGELDLRTRDTFNTPNGVILALDRSGRNVFVSLGKADALKPQATFSVYQRPESGLGRGPAKGELGGKDVKGAIEISRVIGPHLSQAHITRENIYTPFAKGDPIYSPLWSSARGEAFSIVGVIDLDQDGKDDRDLLFQAVAATGAVIDNDLDEKGVLRTYGKVEKEPRLTNKTKFLVIGRIPEVTSSRFRRRQTPGAFLQMHALLKDLQDLARERGVHVLNLGDFLNYIGYKPQKRLIVPGDSARSNVKSGAASAPHSRDKSAPQLEESPECLPRSFRPL